MNGRRRGTGNRVALAVAVVVLGCAALYSYRGETQGSDVRRTSRAGGQTPVPVSVAVATRQSFPVYLAGLGTVQALLTVGIHSQVDGKLQEVPFAEGQMVKKGDVIARIDPRLFQAALDQAKAKKAQDEAQLVAAQKDLTRFKTLALKSFETEQNVDLQQAKVDQLKATIDADIAAIEVAQTQLEYTTITAPSDGRLGVRLVDPGNVVHASDSVSIATLVQTRPATVLFTLPARVLDEVREAMTAGPVEVSAFDQDNQRRLSSGMLLMVDNAIDQTTATIRLKATFANEDERLWPGEFVNARLLLVTQTGVVAVPSNAVQRGPQGLFAWIVTEKNTAEARQIQVGPATDDLTVITSGLNEGDRVVIDGQYKLQTDAPVTIAPVSAPAQARNAS